MADALLFALWVLAAGVTNMLVFPGMIEDWPGGWDGYIMGVMMIFVWMLIWPLYAAVGPFAYGFLWLIGDWKPSEHFSKGRKP